VPHSVTDDDRVWATALQETLRDSNPKRPSDQGIHADLRYG
jgi:hypothetical protein